jgi:hypothetical protein
VTATGLLAYCERGHRRASLPVEAISEGPRADRAGEPRVLDAAGDALAGRRRRLLVADGPADAPQGVITDLDVLRALP